MSDRLKIIQILIETEACFGVPLDDRQSKLISNMLRAMKRRIPKHIWCDMPDEALSALHLRNLIDSGAMPPDSLNAKGWDALQYADEKIEAGRRVMADNFGRRLN